MPAYGIPQAGSNSDPTKNLTSLSPGDKITLFDGTEAAASGLASVAFSRAFAPNGSNAITFYLSGAPAGTTIDIQGSNTDVDGDYFTVNTIVPDDNGNGAYTDNGVAAFMRAKYSAYTTGAASILKAQR